MITPTEFARYLKNSTLSREDQEGLLNILQYLLPEQIEDLSKILKKDNDQQEKYFRQAKLKLDMLVQASEKEMIKLKQEHQK